MTDTPTYSQLLKQRTQMWATEANKTRFDAATQAEFKQLIYINRKHQGYDFAKIVISNWKGSDSELDIFNALVSQFGDAVLSTKMKHSEAVKRCASEHSSVFEFSRSMDSKKGKALEAAQANCKEVVADIHKLITDVWKQQDKGEEQ